MKDCGYFYITQNGNLSTFLTPTTVGRRYRNRVRTTAQWTFQTQAQHTAVARSLCVTFTVLRHIPSQANYTKCLLFYTTNPNRSMLYSGWADQLRSADSKQSKPKQEKEGVGRSLYAPNIHKNSVCTLEIIYWFSFSLLFPCPSHAFSLTQLQSSEGVQTLRTQDTSHIRHFRPRTLRTQDTSALVPKCPDTSPLLHEK